MLRRLICKTINLAVCLISVGMLAGCKEDSFADWFGTEDGVKISYSIDGMIDENGNRSVSSRGFNDDNGNDMLRSVHILFFEPNGTYIGTSSVVNNGASINTEFISITTPGGIIEGKSYKTLIVGNAHEFHNAAEYISFEDYIEQTKSSYKEMRKKLSAYGQPSGSSFPLTGVWIDGKGASSDFMINDGMANGSIKFTRTVCRIDFVKSSTANFKIESFQICNVRKGVNLFQENIAEDWQDLFPRTNIDDIIDESTWLTPATPDGFNSEMSSPKAFYIFPNADGSPKGESPETTTCIIIKGIKQGATETRYYRFDLVNSGSVQELHRNNVYRACVTAVTGEGYADAFSAWNAGAPINITLGNGYKWQNSQMGRITVEGFDHFKTDGSGNVVLDDVSNTNGVIARPLAMTITHKWDAGYTVEVESTFDSNIDAYLSTSAGDVKKFAENNHNITIAEYRTQNIKTLSNNSTIYLQVYRTGPGDPDITGYVHIRVKSPDGIVVISKSLYVTIHTSCIVGDAIMLNDKVYTTTHLSRHMDMNLYPAYLIPDRNQGTPPPFNADGTRNQDPARNYNANLSFTIGGYSEPENDNTRAKWSGTLTPTLIYDGQPLCKRVIYMQAAGGRTWWSNTDPLYMKSARHTGNVCPWEMDFSAKGDYSNPTELGYDCTQSLYSWDSGFYVSKDNERQWFAKNVETPMTKNTVTSKMRCIILSDFKDKATGSFVGSYIPAPEGICEHNYEYLDRPTGCTIWAPVVGKSFGPMIKAQGHGTFFDFSDGVFYSYCATPDTKFGPEHKGRQLLGQVWVGTIGYWYLRSPERMRRWISSEEWANVRSRFGYCWKNPEK